MNQSKAFLTSLAFASLAMLLVYFYVSEKESSLKAEFGSDVTVVVASRDINEMEQIQANMLNTIVVPKKFAQPGSNPDKQTFEGAVAGSPVRAGEQVLMTKVLLKGAETGLASQVAISRRAISLSIDDTKGVTRLIKPGDRVDILSPIHYRTPQGTEVEVKTILQDVHILAAGELIQNNIPSAFEDDPISGTKKAVNLRGSRTFTTVTVEVTPQEAQLLLAAQTDGELFLTLRNPVDRIVSSIPTSTVDEVLGPNSKKAEMERRLRTPAAVAAPIKLAPPPPPPPNPWQQGGGTLD